METHEIRTYWQTRYPECEPIPYLLKDAYRSRWVRFHSLPESKRYPESESEYQIILDRHNAVIETLATPNEQLLFSSTGYSDTPELIRDEAELNEFDPNAIHWLTIAKHELDLELDYPNYWHLYSSTFLWVPGVFDSIFRLVADDTLANIMIISPTNHWIFHPYDGGADIILETTDSRDTLKAKFGSWLSQHSSGL